MMLVSARVIAFMYAFDLFICVCVCIYSFSFLPFLLMYIQISLSLFLFLYLYFASCSPRFEIHFIDGKKREKSSRFLAGLKNKKDKRHLQSESPDRHLKLLETIRLQMQASYDMPFLCSYTASMINAFLCLVKFSCSSS